MRLDLHSRFLRAIFALVLVGLPVAALIKRGQAQRSSSAPLSVKIQSAPVPIPDKGLVDYDFLSQLGSIVEKIGHPNIPLVVPVTRQPTIPVQMRSGALEGVRGQLFSASYLALKNPTGFTPEQEQALKQAHIDLEKARAVHYSYLEQSGRASDMWLYLHTLNGASDTVQVRQVSLGPGDYVKQGRFLDDHRLLLELGGPFSRYAGTVPFLFDFSTNKWKRLGQFYVQLENIQFSPDLRYAAFLQGPDVVGDTHYGAAYLTIADLQSNQEHIVATGDSLVAGSWVWASNEELLFGYQPSQAPPNQFAFREFSEAQKQQARQAFALARAQVKVGQGETPNIYRVKAQGGPPELLLSNAWRPQPSPDGKHLAFFGPQHPNQKWPLATDWQINPHKVSLEVASINGSARKVLGREDITYPTVVWRSATQLLSLKTDPRNGGAWGVVAQYDLTNNSFKRLAALKALDGALETRPLSVMPYFDNLKVSNNGQFLWVKTHEFGVKKNSEDIFERYESIWGVELDKGAVFLVARAKEGWGVAWNDQGSTSPTPPDSIVGSKSSP